MAVDPGAAQQALSALAAGVDRESKRPRGVTGAVSLPRDGGR